MKQTGNVIGWPESAANTDRVFINQSPPMNQNRKKSLAMRLLTTLVVFTAATALLGGGGLYIFYRQVSPQLPKIDSLRNVKYQVPLMVFTKNNDLIGQFGEKKRVPVSVEDVPEKLVQAFLAAEDDRFFDHPGFDYQGLLRAAINYARTGEKRQGGSTITMQVARNFFLTPEKTFMRKIKEILLAIKIENELGKDQILELYLNKIYLGHRSYGINAAAQVYYGKRLDELDLAQMAMIAGLPKAPSRYNPVTNPDRALTRRNYVLRRMHELGFISSEQFQLALRQPVTAELHATSIDVEAPYVAEMVRENMYLRFGDKVYSEGFKVFTSVDSKLQQYASAALRDALHQYDERHGFRGVEGRIEINPQTDKSQLVEGLKNFRKIGDTLPGAVISYSADSIQVVLRDAQIIEIPRQEYEWVWDTRPDNSKNLEPKASMDFIQPGDIIRVRLNKDRQWRLAQVPPVEGAFVSLNPSDGSILALVGGFDFFQSKYNRAIQSKRQPGSLFKPILYTKALEENFTVASIINDAPIVFDDRAMDSEWRPENYSGRFYGPTRLRVALRNSRNLVSIRLMRDIGIQKVIDSAKRFGIPKRQLPNSLSLALGSGSASSLEMARAYSVFANGGFLVEPYFISRIETAKGEVIFEAAPKIACSDCFNQYIPSTLRAPRVVSPRINYIMNSLLKDVIRNGTGRRALKLNRYDLAGKTGTTNEQKDAWFSGFVPSMVASAWVGYDSSKPLGHGETGGKAALPMWMSYMENALAGVSEVEIAQPDGLVSVRIDPETGLLASPQSQNGIVEIFRIETAPTIGVPPNNSHGPARGNPGENAIESLF